MALELVNCLIGDELYTVVALDQRYPPATNAQAQPGPFQNHSVLSAIASGCLLCRRVQAAPAGSLAGFTLESLVLIGLRFGEEVTGWR